MDKLSGDYDLRTFWRSALRSFWAAGCRITTSCEFFCRSAAGCMGLARFRGQFTASVGQVIIAFGLLHPVHNGLRGRFEITRQLFRRSARSDQLDHLSPELRRISSSKTGHGTLQNITSRVSTKPGQPHVAGSKNAFAAQCRALFATFRKLRRLVGERLS